eukprot:PITA_07247
MRGLIVLQMKDVTRSKAKEWSTSPCAGCKIQRKKCSQKCVLAPYFPQRHVQNFLVVQRVFGNGNVKKLLKALPVEQRGDAVRSLVYEAQQRFRDPVHGCVGVIDDLTKKLLDVQSQLASTRAELANISVQHTNLLTSMITEGSPNCENGSLVESEEQHANYLPVIHDEDPVKLWEQFWT